MNSTSKSSTKKVLKTVEQIYSVRDPITLKKKRIKHSINFKKGREWKLYSNGIRIQCRFIIWIKYGIVRYTSRLEERLLI